jgi:hypothetical protein
MRCPVLEGSTTAVSLYFNYRPRVIEKIVEKPVEKIVEKPVPQECPQPKQKVESKKSQSVNQENQGGSNNTNTQIGTTQAPIAIAPNGIANAAPNLGTQSVNNFGPPPVTFTWATRDIVPPVEADNKPSQYKYEKEVIATPSAAYTPVSIAVSCDSEIEAIDSRPDGASVLTTHLNSLAATDKRIGLVYFGGTAITPSKPLIMHIWANQPFSVQQVAQTHIKGFSD